MWALFLLGVERVSPAIGFHRTVWVYAPSIFIPIFKTFKCSLKIWPRVRPKRTFIARRALPLLSEMNDFRKKSKKKAGGRKKLTYI